MTAFLGNTSSALNGGSDAAAVTRHQSSILRATGPLGPGVLASPPAPYKTSRLNAYMKAGGYTKLAQGLDSFITAHCTGGRSATLAAGRLHQRPLRPHPDLRDGRRSGSPTPTTSPAPPCRQQGTQSSIGGPPNQDTDYLHVNPRVDELQPAVGPG